MSLKNATDANFQQEVLNAPSLVLVDFWATWCGPCRMLAPTLEAIQEEMGEKVSIVKVNIEENPQIAAQYRITNIPYMMFFKGGQTVGSLLGNQPKGKIQAAIESHL